jgi:putative endonuclease
MDCIAETDCYNVFSRCNVGCDGPLAQLARACGSHPQGHWFESSTAQLGHYVYILRSLKDSSLYVGQTRNVQQRLARHNDPREKSYTSKRGPWELAYSEEHPNRSSAVQRETFLKSCAGAYEKRTLAGLEK